MDDKLSMLTEEGMAVAVEYTLDKVKECRTAALNEVREGVEQIDFYSVSNHPDLIGKELLDKQSVIALLTNLEKGK